MPPPQKITAISEPTHEEKHQVPGLIMVRKTERRVGRNHCRQSEGQENISSLMQACAAHACTHTNVQQLWASPAFSLGDTFPTLTLSSSNTAKPWSKLFLIGTKSSPHKLPKCSYHIPVELWWGISADIRSPAEHFSFLCQRSCSPKKPVLWLGRPDDKGSSAYWFLACWKHHFFFSFFWHADCIDRWQRRKWS